MVFLICVVNRTEGYGGGSLEGVLRRSGTAAGVGGIANGSGRCGALKSGSGVLVLIDGYFSDAIFYLLLLVN